MGAGRRPVHERRLNAPAAALPGQVADEVKDQPAADYIIGHEVPHMSSIYRETISDERLRAVAEHVRKWLFPSTAFAKATGEGV